MSSPAASPRLLLLDEPLSALDANLRSEMRELIKSLQRDGGYTTVFVTHDQEEAVVLADRIAPLFTLEATGTELHASLPPHVRLEVGDEVTARLPAESLWAVRS